MLTFSDLTQAPVTRVLSTTTLKKSSTLSSIALK